MQKIVFVSHCILNTASKVVLYNREEIEAEEALRRKFLSLVLENGIQVVQLPCPEFTLYGSKRWGHVSEQFDNPFFRGHCRKILEPVIAQMKEYLLHPESFRVLGVVGVDGSPSCGVDYTCSADWYGSFEGRKNLDETLAACRMISGKGILMDELEKMLRSDAVTENVPIVSLYAPEEKKCLSLVSRDN